MAVITGRDSWPLDNQEVRMKKGPLIKIELQPGRFVKMYEQDAIAQGLVEPKAKPPKHDKMQRPEENKIQAPEEDKAAESEAQPADDFTQIPGVGPATARAIVAHNITTFEQLREAPSLDFLPERALESVKSYLGDEPEPEEE